MAILVASKQVQSLLDRASGIGEAGGDACLKASMRDLFEGIGMRRLLSGTACVATVLLGLTLPSETQTESGNNPSWRNHSKAKIICR